MKVIYEWYSDSDGTKQSKTIESPAVPSRGDYVVADGRSRQLKRVTWKVVDTNDQHVLVDLY